MVVDVHQFVAQPKNGSASVDTKAASSSNSAGFEVTSLTEEVIEKMQAEVPPYLRLDASFTTTMKEQQQKSESTAK